MAQRDLRINLSAETRGLERGLQRAERAMTSYERSIEDANQAMMRLDQELQRDIDNTLAEVEANAERRAESFRQLGTGMMIGGAAIVAGLGMAGRAAMQWESDWASVAKTVEGSDAQMEQLEDSLRGLALQIPVTSSELAQIASSAGQLGIETQNIASFTRTIAEMGVTTNLTVGEAAMQMARFSNIMGTPQEDIDRLGASIVHLGNNSATTEADILAMGLRVAGAGKTIGLTEDEVLAFSAALSSVGLEAEGGGSAISRVMVMISDAVQAGGDDLAQFANVAGESATDFATAFQEDPAEAIATFIEGLGQVQEQGGNVFAVLQQLGVADVEVRDALLRAAGASDVLTEALATGSEAWQENTALAEEAAQRFETTESQVQTAQNAINELGISLGEGLLPIMGAAAERVTNWGTAFSSLSDEQQGWVASIGGATGAVSLLTGALIVAGPKLFEFRDSMMDLAEGGSNRFRRGLGATAAFLTGPYGAAIGGVMALGALWLDQKAQQVAAEQEWATALAETGGAIDASITSMAAQRLEEEGLLEAGEELGLQQGFLTQALLEEGEARRALATAESFAQAGKQGLIEDLEKEGDQVKELNEALEMLFGAGTTWKDLTDEQWQAVQDLNGGLSEQVETFNAGKEAQAASAAETENSAEKYMTAAEAADNYRESVNRLTDTTLNAIDAEIAWEESIDKASDAVEKNGATLDLNTEAGRANQRSLNDMVKAGNEHIAMLIEDGASSKDLRKAQKDMRKEIYEAALAMGASAEEAEEYADMLTDVPENVKTAIDVNAKGQWMIDRVTGRGEGYMGGLATGGAVTGPGSGTSDSVLAHLSAGEHVLTAREVQMLGGQEAVYALRDLIKHGDLRFAGGGAVIPQRFARGGAVLPESARIIDDHDKDTRIRIQRLIDSTISATADAIGEEVKKYYASGAGVVRQATKWEGTPYSWGGGGIGGPSRGFGRGAPYVGFDCSSLMQYAWYHGTGGRVTLPRVTYGQINAGRGVSRANARPGDLLFPHRGHVAMYVGGDRMFHTFATGSTASFARAYSNPIAVRRPGSYDDGGLMYPGQTGINTTRRPERVLDPATTAAFDRLVDGLLSRPGAVRGGDGPQTVEQVHYHVHHVPGYSTVQDLQRADERRQRAARVGRAR